MQAERSTAACATTHAAVAAARQVASRVPPPAMMQSLCFQARRLMCIYFIWNDPGIQKVTPASAVAGLR